MANQWLIRFFNFRVQFTKNSLCPSTKIRVKSLFHSHLEHIQPKLTTSGINCNTVKNDRLDKWTLYSWLDDENKTDHVGLRGVITFILCHWGSIRNLSFLSQGLFKWFHYSKLYLSAHILSFMSDICTWRLCPAPWAQWLLHVCSVCILHHATGHSNFVLGYWAYGLRIRAQTWIGQKMFCILAPLQMTDHNNLAPDNCLFSVYMYPLFYSSCPSNLIYWLRVEGAVCYEQNSFLHQTPPGFHYSHSLCPLNYSKGVFFPFLIFILLLGSSYEKW